jgi:hypothetical protein
VGIVSAKNTVPVLKQKIWYRYQNKNTVPVLKQKSTVPVPKQKGGTGIQTKPVPGSKQCDGT